MITRFLMIFVLASCLVGCWKSSSHIDEDMRSGEEVDIFWERTVDVPEVSKLVAFFAAEMYDKYRLELEDSCVLRDAKSIYRFYLSFSSQRLITLCEARLLLVEVADEFLNRVNSHSILGFQLDHSPLTGEDVDFNINFESFFGLYVDPLYIGKIMLWEGMSYFYAFNIKNPDADWSNQKFEPYFKSRELALAKKEADMAYSKGEAFESKFEKYSNP